MTGTATVEVMDGGGDFGGTLTAEEDAYFESGGNGTIPGDTGADAGGDAGGSAGGDQAGADAGKKAPAGGADHVPLATFLEEKNSRKALAKDLAEAQKQIAEFRGKFSIIERLQNPAAAGGEAPPAPPKLEEDVFGFVKNLGDTVAKIQGDKEAEAKARDEAEKAAAEQKTFVDNYQADAATFTQTNPDYKAAYTFLLNSRAQELQALGYQGKELHDAIVADEFAIAQRSIAAGKSPAAALYDLAKLRGYKNADGPNPDTGKGAEKLDAIERGQNANKSLNGAGGAPAGDPGMTAERLLAMPMEEFETWCAKHPAQAKRIMGG